MTELYIFHIAGGMPSSPSHVQARILKPNPVQAPIVNPNPFQAWAVNLNDNLQAQSNRQADAIFLMPTTTFNVIRESLLISTIPS